MRSSPSSSPLVGLLSQWAGGGADVSRHDWAQQLGSWLNPFDAIALHGAHQAIQAFAATGQASAAQAAAGTLDDTWRRLRTDLGAAIAGYNLPDAADEDLVVTLGFSPYRQRYLELQRRMELRINPFRDHCRRILSQTNVRLRQLAELDAALEQALGKREKTLLAKVPALIEKRFEHLRKDAQDESKAASWLAAFDRDFQAVMHAELHFRLEPVGGLIEAFNNESQREQ